MTIRYERTPDGRRLTVCGRVDAPRDRAWRVLTDTERWPEWGPSITAVEASHRFVEAGTTGRVRIRGGFWVPFEVTACRDGRWSWQVAGIRATGHRVEPVSGASCRVCFEVPPVAAPYVLICVVAIRRIARIAERA